jgi:hypothetical protein
MTIDQRTPAQYCDDVIRAYTAAIHAALTGSDDVEPFARIVSPHIRNLAHMAKLRCVMRAAQINQRLTLPSRRLRMALPSKPGKSC